MGFIDGEVDRPDRFTNCDGRPTNPTDAKDAIVGFARKSRHICRRWQLADKICGTLTSVSTAPDVAKSATLRLSLGKSAGHDMGKLPVDNHAFGMVKLRRQSMRPRPAGFGRTVGRIGRGFFS